MEQDYRLRADGRRLRKMAREQFSASLMNSTRWRELVEAVQGLKTGGFRVKFIDDEQVWEVGWIISPSPSYIESGVTGPMLFVAIEWLEILPSKPQQDATTTDQTIIDELHRRLQVHRIPFSEEAGVFRVVGHLRA